MNGAEDEDERSGRNGVRQAVDRALGLARTPADLLELGRVLQLHADGARWAARQDEGPPPAPRPAGRCVWYRRFWHERLRTLDRRYVRPLFESQCAKIADSLAETGIGQQMNGRTLGEIAQEAAESAWTGYCAGTGREYWRCACAPTVAAAARECAPASGTAAPRRSK